MLRRARSRGSFLPGHGPKATAGTEEQASSPTDVLSTAASPKRQKPSTFLSKGRGPRSFFGPRRDRAGEAPDGIKGRLLSEERLGSHDARKVPRRGADALRRTLWRLHACLLHRGASCVKRHEQHRTCIRDVLPPRVPFESLRSSSRLGSGSGVISASAEKAPYIELSCIRGSYPLPVSRKRQRIASTFNHIRLSSTAEAAFSKAIVSSGGAWSCPVGAQPEDCVPRCVTALRPTRGSTVARVVMNEDRSLLDTILLSTALPRVELGI